MLDLAAIYREAERQHVSLFPCALGFARAATIELEGRYGVFFDTQGTNQEIKRVLAHELGHCATGCTHKVSSSYDLIAKHEYKADRWAIEYCLPFEDLRRAMRYGMTEPWQLADWFDLPEPFIRLALDYYTGAREMDFNT